MRVLVAGATGDLGRPLVRRLVAAGHEVTGLSRSEGKRALLERLGARPVIADALDREAVRRAVAEARPEAVVDALTALPRRGPMRRRDLEATNRLRREGTANLVTAAVNAGVRRYVGESVAFVYGYGDAGRTPVTEDQPPARPEAEHPSVREPLAALHEKERMILEAPLEGVVLRYGLFYGPSAGSTGFMVRMLRRRLLALPGHGPGVASWIHVEDAAAATAAAADGDDPEPLYNVVDDEPVSFRAFTEELARVTGAPRPYAVPAWMARPFAPYTALFMTALRLPVSNARARRSLGWAPAFPTHREGLADVAAALAQSP